MIAILVLNLSIKIIAVNVLKPFNYVDALKIHLMVLLNCITTTDDKAHKAHRKLISKTLI